MRKQGIYFIINIIIVIILIFFSYMNQVSGVSNRRKNKNNMCVHYKHILGYSDGVRLGSSVIVFYYIIIYSFSSSSSSSSWALSVYASSR